MSDTQGSVNEPVSSLSELANTEGAAPTTTPVPDAPTQGTEAESKAAPSALSDLADDPNDLSWIPEKYAVKNDKGELDPVSTLKKVEEGRAALEKRLGTGELPPKDIAEYKVELSDIPEEAVANFVNDDSIKAVMAEAHKLGYTNAQLNFLLQGIVAVSKSESPDEIKEKSVQATIGELKKEWSNLSEYKANFAAMDKALAVYGNGIDPKDVMQNPAMAKILYNIGKSMGEGKVPAPQVIDPQTFAEQKASIMASEAYNDGNHPEHNLAVEKLAKLHERMFAKVS